MLMEPWKYISKVRKNNDPEIDLHGMRVHEAIELLDYKIPEWMVAFDFVRVMHGHGTGKLRSGVVSFLKKHPSVREVVDTPEGLRCGYVTVYF